MSKRRRHRALSIVLIACGIALLVVAGGLGLRQWLAYHHQDQEMASFQEHVTLDESDAASEPPQVDWAALHALSPSIVGWIEIPGTPVNYAVFQGDDNKYWLRHDAAGDYSIGGEVFLDADDTAPGMVEQQSILYGHHLKNGTMFKAVADMDSQEKFDAVPTVWYCTEQQDYELEPLFLYYTQPEDSAARQVSWASDDEFHAYLSDLLARSVVSRPDAADIIGRTSHVLKLSTCNYYDGYGRTQLVCVPKSEADATAGAR